jgi:hypothetical protein
MAILAAGTHGSFKRESNQRQFHCGRCSMKTVPFWWMFFSAKSAAAR